MTRRNRALVLDRLDRNESQRHTSFGIVEPPVGSFLATGLRAAEVQAAGSRAGGSRAGGFRAGGFRTIEAQASEPLVLWLGVALLAFLGVLVGSPILLVGGPGLVFSIRLILRRTSRRRILRQQDRLVIELADQLGQQVGAGSALPLAVDWAMLSARPADGQVGGTPAESAFAGRLDEARRAYASGEHIRHALARAATDQLPSLELLVTALGVLLQNGGPATVALDRVADTLRAGSGARDEAAAQTGQAAASAGMLAVLPFAFAGIVAAVQPSLAQFYSSTWLGAGCLVGAGGLSLASWFWIDWAVNR